MVVISVITFLALSALQISWKAVLGISGTLFAIAIIPPLINLWFGIV